MHAFSDVGTMVKKAAGQAILALLGALEAGHWPECLRELVAMLNSPDSSRQEVSALFIECTLSLLYYR